MQARIGVGERAGQGLPPRSERFSVSSKETQADVTRSAFDFDNKFLKDRIQSQTPVNVVVDEKTVCCLQCRMIRSTRKPPTWPAAEPSRQTTP